jgi:hypothetical protein
MPTVSWHDEEYDALQIDFATRGKRLDETSRSLGQTVEGNAHQFFWRILPVQRYLSPKPNRERLKLWFGGMSLRPGFLKRIVAYGDGLFMGFPLSVEDRALLIETFAAAGRNADELEIAAWAGATLPKDGPADICRTLDEHFRGW